VMRKEDEEEQRAAERTVIEAELVHQVPALSSTVRGWQPATLCDCFREC